MNTLGSLARQVSAAMISSSMLAAVYAQDPTAENVPVEATTAPGVTAPAPETLATTIPTPPPVSAAAVPAPAKLTPAQLDQMTAPIALYPDPLLAATLAAATTPADVIAASRWRAANPAANEQDIEAQPWQPAVKTLIRYPATLNLLAQYLEWTTTLGNAYVTQQADVMVAIQRKRAQAVAQKNLFTTPQQQVTTVDNSIAIAPANPNIMYVPIYDPSVVYVQSYDPGISFGYGTYVGSWYTFNLDWGRRCIVRGPWWGHHGGHHHGHWPGDIWSPGRTGPIPPPRYHSPPVQRVAYGADPTARPIFGNYGPANLSQLPGGRLPYSNFGLSGSNLPRMEWSSRYNRFGNGGWYGPPRGAGAGFYGSYGGYSTSPRWSGPSYGPRPEFRGYPGGATGPRVNAPSFGARPIFGGPSSMNVTPRNMNVPTGRPAPAMGGGMHPGRAGR